MARREAAIAAICRRYAGRPGGAAEAEAYDGAGARRPAAPPGQPVAGCRACCRRDIRFRPSLQRIRTKPGVDAAAAEGVNAIDWLAGSSAVKELFRAVLGVRFLARRRPRGAGIINATPGWSCRAGECAERAARRAGAAGAGSAAAALSPRPARRCAK